MAKYITDLGVSLNVKEERTFQEDGFTKINTDLHIGKGIYLWYKKEMGQAPITRMQVAYNVAMDKGLTFAGYKRIHKDVNAGDGGDSTYLWYFRGSGEHDSPIVEIEVQVYPQAEAMKIKQDWDRLPWNLNRHGEGPWISIWLKREKQTYLCDVTVTDSYDLDAYYFTAGYMRFDAVYELEEAPVVFWCRLTTNANCGLTDLGFSPNESDVERLTKQQFKPVNVKINQIGGDAWYLWFNKQDGQKPIKWLSLLHNPKSLPDYKKAGITVLESNLNSGTKGGKKYMCFHQ